MKIKTCRSGREIVIAALALVWLSGCSTDAPAVAEGAPSQPAATTTTSSGADLPDVLATIGDEQVTMADVRAKVGENLDQLDAQYQRSRYKLVDRALQDILRDRVLGAEAAKQGKTVQEMVLAEAGGTFEPTEVQISSWYQANQARVGGRTLEQVRPQIANLLMTENQKRAAEQLQRRMTTERAVKINLEPYRVSIVTEGAPAVGPANAPVTLVEFSDFQCPFCGRFYPTLKQLEDKFGDKLRIVYKQYPIASLHPNAVKAAEASLCAADQKKFWELHDMMFQDQDKLAVRDLKEKAGRLGMNQREFDRCLDTGRYTEQVQNDLAEGGRLGVTGTPALFVNGVLIEGGAVSTEIVAAAIERELERAAR